MVEIFRRRSRHAGATDVAVAGFVFIVLYVLLVSASPIQLSVFSITNFLALATTLAIAAAGTTLTLLIGGFDLSVAGTISLTNVIAATAMSSHPEQAWLIALLLVGLGLIVGLANGLLVVGFGLPSLGVTLGTYIILSGIALVILPAPGGAVPSQFIEVLTGKIGPIPFSAIVLAALALLWFLFTKTRTGMSVFAIGGDEKAARLSGIGVKRVQVLCFTLAGALYACAGLFFSALTATGSPSAGQSYLLPTFAAAAVGLVSFAGGRGSAIAAILGAGTLTVIPKLLFAWGIADFWVGTFQGIVILLALGVPHLRKISVALQRTHSVRHPHKPVSEEATPVGNKR